VIAAALLLLAACGEPAAPPGTSAGISGPLGPSVVAGLPLPDALPFAAVTRAAPVTLVERRGEPLRVLEGLGVALEVLELTADRGRVRCAGCREPTEGWLQRSVLLPLEGASGGLTDDDAMLLSLYAQASEARRLALSGGLVADGEGFSAPPWHAEDGYSGAVVRARPAGEGWTLLDDAAHQPPAAAPEAPSGDPK
jgi:hypothetical protein